TFQFLDLLTVLGLSGGKASFHSQGPWTESTLSYLRHGPISNVPQSPPSGARFFSSQGGAEGKKAKGIGAAEIELFWLQGSRAAAELLNEIIVGGPCQRPREARAGRHSCIVTLLDLGRLEDGEAKKGPRVVSQFRPSGRCLIKNAGFVGPASPVPSAVPNAACRAGDAEARIWRLAGSSVRGLLHGESLPPNVPIYTAIKLAVVDMARTHARAL
ncbi:hypothetical protein E4U43_005805, partial [Claviceps pusilla]